MPFTSAPLHADALCSADASALLVEGKSRALERDYAGAINNIKYAIGMGCSTYESWYAFGEAFYETKETEYEDDALDAFQKARNLAKSSEQAATAMGMYARVLQAKGELALATQYYREAVRLHPHPAPDWISSNARILIGRKITTEEVSRVGGRKWIGTLMPVEWTQAGGAGTPSGSDLKADDIKVADNRGESLDVQILFRLNSVELADGASLDMVRTLAAGLTSNQANEIWLLGHTDTQGSPEYNLELSRKRALSVYNTLLRMNEGLATKLKWDGVGEYQPIFKGNTPEDHRLNRRLEIFVSTGSQP